MNPMPELTPMLKQLRLSGILDSLETRNRQAIEEKMAYTDFLGLILQDEIARRSQKRLAPGPPESEFSQPEDFRSLRFLL